MWQEQEFDYEEFQEGQEFLEEQEQIKLVEADFFKDFGDDFDDEDID